MLDDNTGEIKGEAVEAARAVAAKCQTSLKFVISPAWSRAYRMAVDGTTDGLLPTIASPERRKSLAFPVQPLIQMEMALISKKNDVELQYTGLAMLDRKRVGKLAGGLVTDDFEAYIRSNEVVVFQRHSYLSLLENLIRDRLDFIAGGQKVFQYYADEYGFEDKLQTLKPALGEIPQYFALSKKGITEHPDSSAMYGCLIGQ